MKEITAAGTLCLPRNGYQYNILYFRCQQPKSLFFDCFCKSTKPVKKRRFAFGLGINCRLCCLVIVFDVKV